MKKLFYFFALFVPNLLIACGPQDDAVRVEKHNGEDLYVCDYFKVKDQHLTLKLSDWVDSLQVIKLENDTNAMIGYSPVYVSDHYMLLRPDWKSPIKLFSREGKYLNDIGKIGRGPGEYKSVYDMQIDEANGLIYILPWQSSYLYVYNLQGDFIKPIQLAGGMPKGKFTVQDSCVKVLALPFKNAVKWVAFYQTLSGRLLDSVAAAPYAVSFDYSNELVGDRDNNALYALVWKGVQDTLYHYIPGNNRLTPRFTIDFGGITEIPMHNCDEIGDYFWFETSTIVPTGENTYTNKPEKTVLVDKKKLTATSSFEMDNDLLGYPTSIKNFSNGYYIENISPLHFKEKLEKAAKREDLSPKVKQRVNDLLAGIDENDNNYIILGKRK